MPHIDVLSLVELVLVKTTVFGAGAVEPTRPLGFDEGSSTGKHADLRRSGIPLLNQVHIVIAVD